MKDQDTQKAISNAERELGAFLTAVRQQYGAGAVAPAADCWIEALQSATPPSDWRRVTIAAASLLARRKPQPPSRLSSATSAG